MPFIKSRFIRFLKGGYFYAVFGILVLVAGVTNVSSMSNSRDEQRRVAAIKATYLTHLINFTHWNKESTINNKTLPKILIIGKDSHGLVESFRFLADRTKLSIQNREVEILHFEKESISECLKLVRSIKPKVIFLLPSSQLQIKEVRKLSLDSLIIGNGPSEVLKNGADISFVYSKNRVRLSVSEKLFTGESPKLSSRLSILRNVLEIIPEKNR